MRQLLLDKGNLVVREVAQPLLHDNTVLVALHYAYITPSTDLSNIQANERFLNNVPQKVRRVFEAVSAQSTEAHQGTVCQVGLPHGYTCTGQVVSVGKKVTRFAPGDFVACVDLAASPHGDLVCVMEHHAVKISKKEYLAQATLIPLAASALQAVRRANIQIGHYVAVFGLNVMGLLIVQLLKITGACVIAIDTDQARLDQAAALKADMLFNASHDSIAKEIALITEGHGVDASYLLYHHTQFFEQSVAVTRKKGKLVLVDDGVFALSQSSGMEDLDIIVSRDFTDYADSEKHVYCPDRWSDNRNMRACLDLLERGSLSFETLITDHVGIDRVGQAAERIRKGLSVGGLLEYEQARKGYNAKQPQSVISEAAPRFVPAVSDKINLGVIGVDDFACTVVDTVTSKLRNVQIHSIVDDARRSSRLSKSWQGARLCSKDDLLTNNAIKAVIISSYYSDYIEQAIEAMRYGKAVFLERPMVKDMQELQRLRLFLDTHAMPFCVDYAYSFSPFVQKIAKVTQKRHTPLMMLYRMSRKPSQLDHHRRTMSGSGRILSDGCQVIDLFCYLTQATPVSISVEAMHSARDDIFPTDNVTSQISFSDGSVCTLVQTTLGHPDMGSDRMEIYFDGSTILMEDYMELYGFGLSSRFNETMTTPDNGRDQLLVSFFSALQKTSYVPPISKERLYTVAQTALMIDQLACQGGGKKEL